MNPNDWRRTEELFHKVVGLSPEERAAYLDQACPDDASLRAEVESLITAFENQRGFLERPAFSLGMKMLSGESKEESLDGKQIGPYRVHSLLGEGGMGKVYLAHDGLLDRKVALKFLSHKFTDDAWAKRQLIKEAQAIARLDHPNICAVHGFEEHEGYAFIVMQYVEGETLASLIQRGLPEAEQIPRLAVQIVSALVEAHSHGIVHRDIKPQNIMVAANGQAKVLDFGLAKLIQQKQDVLNAGESESSQLGLVLGTVAYMSPEQLRDERLDFRSDIFSFGIVLYEMICGRNPYSRATKADTISAILTSGPEWPPKLPTDIQARLAAIAQKCLRKEREQRYQSASELLLALDNPDKRNPTPWPRPIRLSLRMYAVLALLLLIIITASFVYFRPVRARTLAVLPIVYEYANANTEYLGEGLTESLINKLSSISTLEVKPLTMVSVYKNQKVDPVQFGRDLNVDLLFLGTIIQEQGSMILQSKLIRTEDGSQLWQRQYVVEPEKMLELLDNLSGQITYKLKLPLSRDERKFLATHQTDNAEAYKMYIRGRHCWRKRDKENIQKAISFFDQAIDLDAAYAEAYSGLADCYLILSTVAYGPLPTKEAMSKARFAAETALGIDDTLCEARTSLGVYHFRHEWNWAGAEKEFKQAIRLNPNYAPAYFWYSNLLALMGHSNDSIAAAEKAKELDPLSPLSDLNLARAYYYARRYDVAVNLFRKMLDENPNDLKALYLLSYVYERQGLYQESINSLEKVYEKDRLFAAAPLGYVYARVGRRADALRILNEIGDRSKYPIVPPQEQAIIYLGLDDKDRAFALLGEACRDRFATLPLLLIDPFLDGIRSDPGFVELARCANLPQ